MHLVSIHNHNHIRSYRYLFHAHQAISKRVMRFISGVHWHLLCGEDRSVERVPILLRKDCQDGIADFELFHDSAKATESKGQLLVHLSEAGCLPIASHLGQQIVPQPLKVDLLQFPYPRILQHQRPRHDGRDLAIAIDRQPVAQI